jgi:uncharacterized protein YbbC (DUF1343 family)
MKKLVFTAVFAVLHLIISAQKAPVPAAFKINEYLPLLKNRAIAVFANQTSTINNTHLVDTLIKYGINIKKIFGPEHGFRGTADAGEQVNNAVDKKTGLPIISLYGNHKKPTVDDLKDVDIVLFDIQDVGVRFYTYISSLEYVLEACLEQKKPLLILDRPNPNGFYVDGPVLDKKFKSFIGMQPIPIVYGMTMGEYALMLAGEGWLSKEANKNYLYKTSVATQANIPFLVQVITCANYTHKSLYDLPINPSPNLKTMQAIYLYPSTCFFEGTVLSEGRGTDMPFQVFGHPSYPKNMYSFTPKPNEGAKSSKCFNQVCYGWNVSGTKESVLSKLNKQINLQYIIDAYALFPQKDSFFLTNNFIHKLAGTDEFKKQIIKQRTAEKIKASWHKGLKKFKTIRKKYLLYTDFE